MESWYRATVVAGVVAVWPSTVSGSGKGMELSIWTVNSSPSRSRSAQSSGLTVRLAVTGEPMVTLPCPVAEGSAWLD